jgi:capsular polysaccharide biosynthesis protein
MQQYLSGGLMDTRSRAGVSVEFAQGEDILSLRALLQVFRRQLWVILLVVTIVVGVTVGFGLSQTPVYEARAEILVEKTQGNKGIENIQTDVQGLRDFVGTALESLHSRRVAEAVVREVDPRVTTDALLANLSVEQVADTQFITIYYRDADPKQAQEIANAVASASSDQVSEVSPAITATVWESAVRPNIPVEPRLFRNSLLALMLGIMLGAGLALLLEYLDDSWRAPEEVELISGAPIFGIIPKFEATEDKSKSTA